MSPGHANCSVTSTSEGLCWLKLSLVLYILLRERVFVAKTGREDQKDQGKNAEFNCGCAPLSWLFALHLVIVKVTFLPLLKSQREGLCDCQFEKNICSERKQKSIIFFSKEKQFEEFMPAAICFVILCPTT